MKILLTAANTRNNGDYVDAGTEVEIGDDADQITLERANELLNGHGRADDAPLELDEQLED